MAVAAPIPELAPVTKTILFFRESDIRLHHRVAKKPHAKFAKKDLSFGD
jgi:hypothetical protein